MSSFPLSRPSLTALAVACLMTLSSCGGGGGDGTDDGHAAVLTDATISGKLVAPNGETPLGNALVYVEGSAQSAAASGRVNASAAAASGCGAPPATGWAATCTAADGSFTWKGKIPAGAKLVAVKGAFKATETVPAAGGDVALGVLSIPVGVGTTRMAVVTGLFDSVEDVLAKLGFGEVESGRLKAGTEKFDLFDGMNSSISASSERPPFTALFTDADGNGKADIFNYAVVFLNCGLDVAQATNPAYAQVLRDYVAQGGRLYVSDQAYDYLEQAFPAYIDFHGSDVVPAATPEIPGQAKVGNGGIAVESSLDPALRDWLGGIGCTGGSCLTGGQTAKIDGFLGEWVVMDGAHATAPSPVKVWVSGPVRYSAQDTTADKPLTVSFAAGKGRVTYTSYHNEPSYTGTGFLPVERILQFLVFEL